MKFFLASFPKKWYSGSVYDSDVSKPKPMFRDKNRIQEQEIFIKPTSYQKIREINVKTSSLSRKSKKSGKLDNGSQKLARLGFSLEKGRILNFLKFSVILIPKI